MRAGGNVDESPKETLAGFSLMDGSSKYVTEY